MINSIISSVGVCYFARLFIFTFVELPTVSWVSQLPTTCLVIFKITIQGTSRPTHYHVLLDEIGFSADDLQELVHSLSYV